MKTFLAIIGLLAILGAIFGAAFFLGGFFTVAANQMDYQAVAALYTRSLGLLKTALGKG